MQELIQRRRAGIQDLPKRFALLAFVGFSGALTDFWFGDRDLSRVSRSGRPFPDCTSQHRTQVGGLFPAAQFSPVLLNLVQELIKTLAEELTCPLLNHLFAFHDVVSFVVMSSFRRPGAGGLAVSSRRVVALVDM
jgi:hypothetical protein